MSLTTLFLKPGEADRLLAGHPWIYSSSILRFSGLALDGDCVQVKDHRQRFIGVGLYNSKSKIIVRLLSRERTEINKDFFLKRFREAAALRNRCMRGKTSYRLVNAESDSLSGLIIDKYEDVCVVQISSLGMDRRRNEIKEALLQVCKPRTIMERSDIASRRFEGLEDSSGAWLGEPVKNITIQLNGLPFEIDLETGHKTGLYLDQQTNYARVAEFAAGANVLDCFSFLGGFGIHAGKAGAKLVRGIDQSEAAVHAATVNAQRNGVKDLCTFETANVFDWLKERTVGGPSNVQVHYYDLIILDPPSFTRSRATVPDALRGYKEIHLRALKLLRPGGVLATFCCSHHVDARLFEEVVLAASYDARKVLRRVASYSQSPDHPILPAIPETEYLKGFAYEIAN